MTHGGDPQERHETRERRPMTRAEFARRVEAEREKIERDGFVVTPAGKLPVPVTVRGRKENGR